MGRETVEASLAMELRRGTIVLMVLGVLEQPTYGYKLAEELALKGMPIDGNTLYPLLRRLSSQGLLTDSWDTSQTKPRKYYRLTKEGKRVRSALRKQWETQARAMDDLYQK